MVFILLEAYYRKDLKKGILKKSSKPSVLSHQLSALS